MEKFIRCRVSMLSCCMCCPATYSPTPRCLDHRHAAYQKSMGDVHGRTSNARITLATTYPVPIHAIPKTSRGLFVVNMSGRLVAGRLSTIARRSPLLTPRFYTTHSLPAGGLLRNEAGLRLVKRRPWPLGSYALHNIPATRSISFARVIPKLVGKFATVGAAAGGAVVAGVSYIQYQAGRMYSCKSNC
jgi:hypothetical protein